MTPVGFEPTISTRERPPTYALDRAATATGIFTDYTAPEFDIDLRGIKNVEILKEIRWSRIFLRYRFHKRPSIKRLH